MKKFLIFILCMLLTGCGTNKEDNIAVTRPVVYQEISATEEMKEMANDLSLMQDKTMLLYKGGLSHDLDLNQDGEREKIFYEKGKFLKEDYISGKLVINNHDYSSLIENMYEVSESFAIGKIKEQYFLMISSLMDNDYTETRIFIYDNDELMCVCEFVEGSPENNLFMYDDLLHTKELTNVLGTDYIDVIYEWNGTEFIKVLPLEGLYDYSLYENKELKLLTEFVFYEERDLNKPLVFPAETVFTSNKTDGKCWSNILMNDKEYWFYNYEFEDISFFEKIEGLIFAG